MIYSPFRYRLADKNSRLLSRWRSVASKPNHYMTMEFSLSSALIDIKVIVI